MSRRHAGALFTLLVAAGAGFLVIATTSVSPERSGRGPGLPLCSGHGTTSGPVPGWRMGAIQFLSVGDGVGLTAARINCFHRTKTGSGLSYRTQPVRLAVSSNGGRSWRLTGAAAPAGTTSLTAQDQMQLVAASQRYVWVMAGGRLLVTDDEGQIWRGVSIGGPVVEITGSRRYIWAVTCRRVRDRPWPLACSPMVWRAAISTGAWTQTRVPRLTAQEPDVSLTAGSGQKLLLGPLSVEPDSAGEVVISTDAGASWRVRKDPSWDGRPCAAAGTAAGAGTVAGAGPGTFWVLCLGGAAAGGSTKGLLQSTDAGSSWHTVSEVKSLTRLPPTGSLPVSEPGALAAGSSERLWLSVTNGLAESSDAGRTWEAVASAVDPGGWSTTISVLDSRHAWLLAPGAGLWSTTDGQHWRAVGPLNTN